MAGMAAAMMVGLVHACSGASWAMVRCCAAIPCCDGAMSCCLPFILLALPQTCCPAHFASRGALCPPPLQGWIIAVIVGVVLIVVPVPAYLLVRWRKRKNKEAAAIQVGSGAAVALVSWLIHAVSCQAQGNEAAAIQMALVLD